MDGIMNMDSEAMEFKSTQKVVFPLVLVSYPTDGGISIGHLVPSVGGCDPSQLGLKSSRPYCHFMGALKMKWHRK